MGEQFLLLPEPIRYLTDRLVSVNTAVPEIDAVYSISSRELLPALAEVFTLETLQISLLPVAIRSFIHHFYRKFGVIDILTLKLLPAHSDSRFVLCHKTPQLRMMLHLSHSQAH